MRIGVEMQMRDIPPQGIVENNRVRGEIAHSKTRNHTSM